MPILLALSVLICIYLPILKMGKLGAARYPEQMAQVRVCWAYMSIPMTGQTQKCLNCI